MSRLLPGMGRFVRHERADAIEYVVTHRPLKYVLAFTGHSIDDIINDPIARNRVIGYYKLYRQVQRRCDIVELENQWNALGA